MAKLITKILILMAICFGLPKKFPNWIIGFEEVGEKSSHYGLYTLGFTCATRAETEGSDN